MRELKEGERVIFRLTADDTDGWGMDTLGKEDVTRIIGMLAVAQIELAKELTVNDEVQIH